MAALSAESRTRLSERLVTTSGMSHHFSGPRSYQLFDVLQSNETVMASSYYISAHPNKGARRDAYNEADTDACDTRKFGRP